MASAARSARFWSTRKEGSWLDRSRKECSALFPGNSWRHFRLKGGGLRQACEARSEPVRLAPPSLGQRRPRRVGDSPLEPGPTRPCAALLELARALSGRSKP